MKVYEIINKVNKDSKGKILLSVYNKETKQKEDFVFEVSITNINKKEYPYATKVESISFFDNDKKAYLHIYSSVS